MRRKKAQITALAAIAAAAMLAVLGASISSAANAGAAKSKSTITIGAVIDQSSTMKPFDSPAIAAALLEVKKIDAAGGVDGHKLRFIVENDQLNPAQTRADALDVISKGAQVLWVTCDVDWATASAQVGLGKGLLTISPCIGTDQMGPKRFGSLGKLAFSFGNVAQDEGAAIAQLAIKHHWKTAVVVTDKSIAFEVAEGAAFTQRFTQLGGKVVAQDSFTQGDHTINSVASKVNGQKAAMIELNTYPSPAGDLPAFVSGVRSLGNQTPIVGPWSLDGAFWLPQNPQYSNNIWFVDYASVYGDDPSKAVRTLDKTLVKEGAAPATGGFVTGAAAVDGIAAAIKRAGGSTNGAKLAAIMARFHNLPTISGNISFSSRLHSVFGREYRIIRVTHGKSHYVGLIKATKPATAGP